MIFLNAGDMLAAPDVLDRLAAFIGQSEADFIFADSWEETAGQRHYKTARAVAGIKTGMITHHQAMVYRRAACRSKTRCRGGWSSSGSGAAPGPYRP